MKSTLLIGLALLGALATAHAEPQQDKCAGILHRDRYGLRFGGGRGEDEGICSIRKADERRVLAICAVEKFCEVSGLVDLCKDAGECVEITNITSVSSRPLNDPKKGHR